MKQIRKNSLIVSCQALKGEPLHGSDIMARMALAAKTGGAEGIRANSPQDIREIRKMISDLPIIGLWKRHNDNYKVYITPRYEYAREVLLAGADYVAIDCTDRERPETLTDIFTSVRNEFPNRGLVADIATEDDARKIFDLKPDFFSTAMSGYTEASRSAPRPNIELIKKLKQITAIPLLAEGNYKNGWQAAEALRQGAHAVVIGGTITRPQQITRDIYNDIKSNLKKRSE